ncbi:MAG: (2Fe-2S)-binding protein [Firmicutes bacterium]|jgi:carbon-monoxide dehydrogenase small subunit|nr:(2Fe-2S)-binding protein [Bacillota bacterium]
MSNKLLTLIVNGDTHKFFDVPHHETLADLLRDRLQLTGTKIACDEGACGSCTVLVDNVPTLSCMTLAHTVEGKKVLTIEGLKNGNELHPIQEAFAEERGFACGYCTPGFVMTTKALLDKEPNPSDETIKEALAGNICRCAVYEHIVDAARASAEKLNGGE